MNPWESEQPIRRLVRKFDETGERAVREADPVWVEYYELQSGPSLVPVGGHSHMSIMADADGRLWSGFDEQFGWLGDDVPGVLNGLAGGTVALASLRG